MLLSLSSCVVRSWRLDDLDSLVAQANNWNIWINLRDRFPHPYTRSDGQRFIRLAREMKPESFFAIEVEGAAAGGIGFVQQQDVERISAEVGYWVGEAFWGRGIATDALIAVTQYAIEHRGLSRLFALPFASNRGSCRVLEKAGYTLEGRLRRSAIKNGCIIDQLQYAFIAPEPAPH
jgi:RimJ/RimL family protein N-acetyltransferase